MPRSPSPRRDRSRSRRRQQEKKDEDKGYKKKEEDRKPEPKKETISEAAKSGGSEQEIVSVAIRQLPTDIRERLEKLFEEGLLKEGDLDLRSITVFASLNEGLQGRVMNHMEGERIYVANARSKSGFLIATCDKAKTGCLDARGLGAIDPWMTALVAMATPKQKMIDLKPERDFLEAHEDAGPIKIHVNVKVVESELGVPQVTVELPLSETAAAVSAKLVAMGVRSIPANRMKLHTDPVGFLKTSYSFGFYNLEDGVILTLSERKRAGVHFKKDHTVMPKRPRTQSDAKASAATAGTAPGAKPPAALAGLPALPQLPKLPSLLGSGSLPALPGLPGLPGLPALGGTAPAAATGPAGGATGAAAPGGLPGLPGLPGMPLPAGPLGKLPGMPGLLPLGTGPALSMPALGKAPGGGLPGLPPPGADPKAAAMAAMGLTLPAPGMTMPGLLPAPTMPGLLPSPSASIAPDPKAADLAKMVENLAKAGPGSSLPGLPPPDADPKAAAIAMMASMGQGEAATGKAQSKAGLPGGMLEMAPVAASTAKAPPMGATAKGGAPAP